MFLFLLLFFQSFCSRFLLSSLLTSPDSQSILPLVPALSAIMTSYLLSLLLKATNMRVILAIQASLHGCLLAVLAAEHASQSQLFGLSRTRRTFLVLEFGLFLIFGLFGFGVSDFYDFDFLFGLGDCMYRKVLSTMRSSMGSGWGCSGGVVEGGGWSSMALGFSPAMSWLIIFLGINKFEA